MRCRIHLSMKLIIPLYYGHSDFSLFLTVTLNWIPVKVYDSKVARAQLTSITLELRKVTDDEVCRVSDSANTDFRMSSSIRNTQEPWLRLRVDFLRDSMLPTTTATPFFFWKKVMEWIFFWKLFKPFFKLDSQQPWFSYAQKWKTKDPLNQIQIGLSG